VEEDQHSKLPGLNKPLPCGRSFKRSCLVCDVLGSTRDNVLAERVKPFLPRRRSVFTAWSEGGEQGRADIRVVGPEQNTIWRGMEKPTDEFIGDPVRGRDVILTATGTGSYRRYDVELDDAPSLLIPGDIGNLKTNEVLSSLPDLEAHLAAMCKALAGTIEDAAKRVYALFTVTVARHRRRSPRPGRCRPTSSSLRRGGGRDGRRRAHASR